MKYYQGVIVLGDTTVNVKIGIFNFKKLQSNIGYDKLKFLIENGELKLRKWLK